MQSTRTVAGFTLQLPRTEGAARIRRHGVLGLEYGKDRLIALMTQAEGTYQRPIVLYGISAIV